MTENKNEASRNLEKALQALEQAKQRVANEKKKQNEKKLKSRGNAITLPPNAPKEYTDRATLWNAVELSEKGQKSQLARMLKASLPNEWSYELAEEVVRDYVQRN